MIKLIAAVGKNNELGKQGTLIWNLPNDLKFFKVQTLDSHIVMGRRTFDSLPKKLPKRVHHVLSKSGTFNKDAQDVIKYLSFKDLIKEITKISKTQDVFVIGGASLYNMFLHYADEIILTEINAECKDADVYFPDFDKTLYTREILGINEDFGITYEHVRYKKK